MALLEERGTERRSVQTARGEGTAFSLAPTVVVFRVTGHMEPAVSELIISYVDERIRRARGRKVHLFQDWLAMEGYDSSCRQQLTTWTAKNLGSFGSLHIAQRSKIVAMGVQVANLALGGVIKTHPDLPSIEGDLNRVLREATLSERA